MGGGTEGTERVSQGSGVTEPHVLVVALDGSWRSHPLPSSGGIVIGRGADVDIRIDEQAVSRHHARLEVSATDGLRVVDLGSANGTLVGGARIRGAGAVVAPGVSIVIGRTVLAVHLPVPASPEERDAPPVLSAPVRINALIDKVAPTSISVLLLGETGVGKDVVAARIHARSGRAAGPLVRLNCAALSSSLLESELFGHERGAFTGAEQTKPGLLEAAAGGTVLLDEVGEMPLEVQAKLLLAIEQRVVRRVGGTRERPIDVRFISATNRELEREILNGRFRADFYHRINGLPLRIPPLRERVDEIDGLAAKFARDAAANLARHPVPRFDDEAREGLRRYGWPGNVRELRSVVERAVLFAEDGVITARELALAELRLAAPEPLHDGDGDPERARVVAVLSECGGNQTRAARKLGIARNTLRARMRKYALPCPQENDPA